jgi:hypothetical protein
MSSLSSLIDFDDSTTKNNFELFPGKKQGFPEDLRDLLQFQLIDYLFTITSY